MESLFLFSGLISGLVFLVPVVLVFGLVVVLALRSDGDGEGRRAYAIYLALASFVALFTLLFASFAAVSAGVDLVANEDAEPAPSVGPPPTTGADDGFSPIPDGFDDELDPDLEDDSDDTRDADDKALDDLAIALIVALMAGAVLHYHHPKLGHLAPPPFDGSAHWRVVQSHRLVVCFTAVVVVLVSAAITLYGIFQAAAPGVSDVADRGDAVANIIRAAYLAVASWLIFAWHMRPAGTRPEPPSAPATSVLTVPPPAT